MNRILANQVAAIITAFKRQRAIIVRSVCFVFIMAEFSDFSLHLFNDSEFQMESSATFPEIVATDLLEMRENQNKNTQRSTKKWVKVSDLWRAERSEVRKLEEIPEADRKAVELTNLKSTCSLAF